MRIAQVAPVAESVPPKLYGGVERIVAYLVEDLVSMGHEVTLFASGDSSTRARLEPLCPAALRLNSPHFDFIPYHLLAVERILQQSKCFDVIHFHTDPLHYSVARRLQIPTITTLHGRLDLHHLRELYSEFRDVPVVSVSHAQRQPLPWLNWVGTVHHGLPARLYSIVPSAEEYVAFLGRMCPEKRPDRAIEIAQGAGIKIKLAAKVDPIDKEYFDVVVRPLLRGSHVEFVGEISDTEKGNFLGNARALICAGDWPEPFGIATIEAMACGVPVVAFRHGAAPEIIDDGVTGFIVEDLDEACQAIVKASQLCRYQIRKVFESRFTANRMTHAYHKIYTQMQAIGN